MENVSLQYELTYDHSMMGSINPRTNYTSEYAYETGNPNLNPSFEDEVTMQFTFHQFSLHGKFINTLSSISTYDVDANGSEHSSYDNGRHDQNIIAYISFPMIQPTQNWMINTCHCTLTFIPQAA